ncbi:hypothetical protein Pan14r_33260 [Crateriforma conspicua]|uniref:Uncharacterized protein n=1 Tax=Crateriforma conspicua TaxID=2527996 RepID=A0A5C5Y5K3_9PLAN|nr:hypothetical protein Pan14r_33260 [Crateriforma conspicua]
MTDVADRLPVIRSRDRRETWRLLRQYAYVVLTLRVRSGASFLTEGGYNGAQSEL